MPLTGNITLNPAGNVQQMLFQNPGTVDSITFTATGVTYPVASVYTLSISDLVLYQKFNIAYNIALFYNFPTLNAAYTLPLPDFSAMVSFAPGPNFLTYVQTSGASASPVFTINIHNGTLVSTFAARASAVTITYQEYLFSYQLLIAFLNKCSGN
jgi:hypothetical protein